MSGGQDEVISVAELARRLRRALQSVAGRQWVLGEVGSLRGAPSGHVYFTLKDESEEAVIDCVMYRMQAFRARRFLREGARVQVLGQATLWAPRGRLQFVVDAARPVGLGARLVALEELKRRLASEGLFALERKRPMPVEPRVIGVVTSPSGAAFHDICSVAFRRGGARIVLSGALVQGDLAPESLCSAFDLIEAYPRLDVIIVGRGGGSDEDLMAFNDERVVRRVARCRVPVVSAVGHEIDVSLVDLAADVRAATPSQAAELVIPDANARAERLEAELTRLTGVLHSSLVSRRMVVDRLRTKLSDPRFLIAERQQYMDELSGRMERCAVRSRERRVATLHALRNRLLARHPRAVIARARAALGPLAARLDGAMRLDLRAARLALSERTGRLGGLSPLAVLERGYAIASDSRGRVVRNASALEAGQAVHLRVHRGSFDAEVTRVLPADTESMGPDSAPGAGALEEELS